MEIRNAIIVSTGLGIEDYGNLSAWLELDYGGEHQCFGHAYALYLPRGFAHHDIWGVAGHFITRILQIAGVSRWDQLKGKTIRAKQDRSKVYAIGHIVNDDWFCPEDDFATLESCDCHNSNKEKDAIIERIKEKMNEHL